MANSKKQVYIASDHAGLGLKSALIGIPSAAWTDLGPSSTSSVDYPDFAELLCAKVLGSQSLGILICGSGIGMSIAANKIRGIRAALVSNPSAARLAREHNAANVLCLGARFLAPEYAAEIVEAFLAASPSTEARHVTRVRKLTALDEKE